MSKLLAYQAATQRVERLQAFLQVVLDPKLWDKFGWELNAGRAWAGQYGHSSTSEWEADVKTVLLHEARRRDVIEWLTRRAIAHAIAEKKKAAVAAVEEAKAVLKAVDEPETGDR